VLGELLKFLREMSLLIAADVPTDAATEDDEEDLFHDVDEDADVFHAGDTNDADSDADVDADEAAEEGDEEAPAEFLDDMEEAMLGSGHDKFVSPLDDVDAFIFFTHAVESQSHSAAQRTHAACTRTGCRVNRCAHRGAERAEAARSFVAGARVRTRVLPRGVHWLTRADLLALVSLVRVGMRVGVPSRCPPP
jgi:hypothetical protein